MGPKFGKNMKTVSGSIFNLGSEQINFLENGEILNIKLENFTFDLSLEDIEVFYEDIEGWQVGSENGLIGDEIIATFVKHSCNV